MAKKDFKRKLAAILITDVVGYSRLMGRDETATVMTLETYKGVMSTLIKEHRGRVVDSPGDNLLAEFSSVVDAVNCAVEIHREISERNEGIPDSQKMEFRIGINVGEVIEDKGKIYGDGVNIAARLESLANPGGTCISGFVYNQIKNKVKLDYDYLGEKTVKNINEPVHVYRVLPFSGFSEPIMSKAKIENMAYPLPEKPSIAVLPFTNMSDDTKQEYFCDGITEEIITALSKNQRLFVIARTSTFTYKGKPVKVQQVSEDLGVRYVLEGSVKRAGDRIRITAQLVDTTTGNHLWAERYDRELKDIFAVQDEITIKILTAMSIELTDGEKARSYSIGTRNLDAFLKVMQARYYMLLMNPDDRIRAKKLIEEAIVLDQDYPAPYTLLGLCHVLDVMDGISKTPKESLMEASKLAQKTLNMDETLPTAYFLSGFLQYAAGQWERAIPAFERALEIDPYFSYCLRLIGMSLKALGKLQEAIPIFHRALRVDPLNPSDTYWGLGDTYLSMERYDEAIRYLKKSLASNPKNAVVLRLLTFCYVAVGRDEEARAVAAEILKVQPKFSVKKWLKRYSSRDQDLKERIQAALLKVGLPE